MVQPTCPSGRKTSVTREKLICMQMKKALQAGRVSGSLACLQTCYLKPPYRSEPNLDGWFHRMWQLQTREIQKQKHHPLHPSK